MNLQNWQLVEYVELEVSDGEQTQLYRLVFATCNNYDIALFNRRRLKVFDHMRATFGENWVDEDEAMALLNVMIGHLMILAALKKVELKQGDAWLETKLPDAWYDFERFPQEVPAGVLDVLTDAVVAAGNNNRVFSILPATEEEKKRLRMTVRP